jgi:hypothetical protein
MHLLRCRNVSAFAAARIVSPLLRQIQSRINQTDSIPSPQRAKHSNLTVVLFAQASIPLARHPYRVLAFLLKAAFINVQPRADLPAHQLISVPRYSIHDRPMSPGRVSEKILQNLIIAVRNRLGHPFHVSLLRLHQAAQILLRCRDHAVVARAEELTKIIAESPKYHAQLFERFVMANPVFKVAFR